MDNTDRALFRTQLLSRHLQNDTAFTSNSPLQPSPCLHYSPPEARFEFDAKDLRKLVDGHHVEERDWLFRLMNGEPELFGVQRRGDRVFASPDYNQPMEQQREMTIKRIRYMAHQGAFHGWVTAPPEKIDLKKFAMLEICGAYDHSLAIKIGVHFQLWGGAIQFLGTKRHHDKWLEVTEKYLINGCFAMTELGHGSNVRGIETVTTYDSSTGEFVINTPCESAQKYWIGGAAIHATHTVVFSQLEINGKKEGVHAFIAQIRDANGNVCPNVQIADCGHKIGLNGVDNGRIWFHNFRIPRENLLNSVADVSSDGHYISSVEDPDQRFAAFMAPLVSGRVTLGSGAIYSAKVGLGVAIRYSLTRRAFSLATNGPEVLLLDYPSHQRRLLPLLAKTYALSFASNFLKMLYVKRTPESNKIIHVYSSAFKATMTWHNMTTLQECREAIGGQGLKTENRVGQLKSEFDVQSTFEGDNNVLMQQVSKALLSEFLSAKKSNIPLSRDLGLEHMNNSSPVIPSQLTSSILRSIQFQTDILCLREGDLLKSFAEEVSHYQAQGLSKQKTLTMTYQLAEDLGKAFSDLETFRSFVEVEANVSAADMKNILGLLRSLYVMITIEENVSFLRYGYLSTANAAAVRKEVAKLCTELRPHALALVSSLGIDDTFLSPIAFNWIEANSWSEVRN
ncbi:hypothetical protein ACET3Z_022854 [Daucus carota]